MQALREWLLTITAIITLISLSASVVSAVREYKLKSQAEKRERSASQAEMDVKIAQLFSQLLRIAENREAPVHSEAAVEQLFARGMVPDSVVNDPQALPALLRDACTFSPFTGRASSVAAITSIAVLGSRYKSLERPAIAGLNSLRDQGLEASSVEAALELLRAGTFHVGD